MAILNCENENTETIIKEIYRINHNDCITEKEALLLYNVALKNPNQDKNVVYVAILSM